MRTRQIGAGRKRLLETRPPSSFFQHHELITSTHEPTTNVRLRGEREHTRTGNSIPNFKTVISEEVHHRVPMASSERSASPFSMAMLMSMRMRMRRINPMHRLRLLDGLNIRQVHSNGLAIASHEHALELLVC